MWRNNERELNDRFETEQGYKLLIYKTEDYQNDFMIAAEKLSFNTDIISGSSTVGEDNEKIKVLK